MSDDNKPAAISAIDALGALPPLPAFDFSLFGETEVQPLARIRKLTAGFLTRNWSMIPHVTHCDDADVTVLDALRKMQIGDGKISLIAYLVKAITAALKEFPQFNASLDGSPAAKDAKLILKKYVHIGVAVDTPKGLLVPVIRNCDQKSLSEISHEIAAISAKARDKGLTMDEMSGGCFSISSLGGIGGTYFTPIINAPEVAILGVCRAFPKPLPAANGGIDWRSALPLSLSYDHRVIDGADAARFTVFLSTLLQQPERL
ncbi:MAG: hypothetical protein JWM78_3009 [Verrucomicrobiaceae bacterium]|nr:hypothetical protein [Verrucomicrobiaceae bacterium]